MTLEQIAFAVGAAVILIGLGRHLWRARGGPGPAVGDGVPRQLRPLANAWFGLNDWPVPFDDERRLIPVPERRRARER